MNRKRVLEVMQGDIHEFGQRRETGLAKAGLEATPKAWHRLFELVLEGVAEEISRAGRDRDMVEFCSDCPQLEPWVADCFVNSDLSHTIACFQNTVRLSRHLAPNQQLATLLAILAHDCRYPSVTHFRTAEIRDFHQLLASGTLFRLLDRAEQIMGRATASMEVRGMAGSVISIHDKPSTHEPFDPGHEAIELLHVHRAADRLDMLGSFGKELARAFRDGEAPLEQLPCLTAAHIIKRYTEEAIEGHWHGPAFQKGLPTIFVTPGSWELFAEKLETVQDRYEISDHDLRKSLRVQLATSKIIQRHQESD